MVALSLLLLATTALAAAYHTMPSMSCSLRETYWDARRNKCRPCTRCIRPEWVLLPCEAYRDTVCGPVSEVRDDLRFSSIDLSKNLPSPSFIVAEPRMRIERPLPEDDGAPWSIVIGVAVGTTVAVIMIIIACIQYRRRRMRFRGLEGLPGQSPLLYRKGRWGTTDFINSLASIDRKLAMDEILERRRKALAEMTCANDYVDEVFVDDASETRNPPGA